MFILNFPVVITASDIFSEAVLISNIKTYIRNGQFAGSAYDGRISVKWFVMPEQTEIARAIQEFYSYMKFSKSHHVCAAWLNTRFVVFPFELYRQYADKAQIIENFEVCGLDPTQTLKQIAEYLRQSEGMD